MAKNIMIQGTMSNAGKSLVTAALCRIFKQDGYRVAPFKSQNMALNSYITKESLEMGRAQVMQAEACGIEPSVLMNPILLKPTYESGCQVILNGKVFKNMGAEEYTSYKENMLPYIKAAYNELEKNYDIIVIEGAGSPAEINLKEIDIVNMGLAKLVHAPVLLVGDIDRGGVFASLAGTLYLFTEDEKNLVKGLIINKFRGNLDILKPGLSLLEERINKKVLGVIPFTDVDIDDEDSLSSRLAENQQKDIIDIAVLRLPHLSNFTDFNSLSFIPGVSVRYISKIHDFGIPDLLIIPGTKDTIHDMLFLRESGLEGKILRYASKGYPIIGICGGYQMLGEVISDPLNIERGGEIRGLGLLPIRTVFAKDKRRTQVEGIFQNVYGPLHELSETKFSGYEIHMGETEPLEEIKQVLTLTDKNSRQEKNDGFQKNNIYATYVHGIFDSQDVQIALAKALYRLKGLSFENYKPLDINEYKEIQYNKLADIVRNSLDMDEIYRILEGGENYAR